MALSPSVQSGIAPTVNRIHTVEEDWIKQFDCRAVRPLIVCRGPVRLEAIEIFKAMGLTHIGMLLSDKDSTLYEDCVSPERFILPPSCVHLIEDYQAGPAQLRTDHIQQIINIAHMHGYNAIFAGYGFMAEAADFVSAITAAGLRFIGPSASVVASAGQKDDAKVLARQVGVSITPGVDALAACALVTQAGSEQGLAMIAQNLGFEPNWLAQQTDNIMAAAHLLAKAREKGEPLLLFESLVAQAVTEIKMLRQRYPGRTFRFKAVGGGGGKGQRLLPPDITDENLEAQVSDLLRTILQEVRATEPTDNQNVLIELNIDASRHQEIQLVGNGQWCVALGGRDCSVQWREQKLVELSLTQEALVAEIAACSVEEVRQALTQELDTLVAMERDAAVFGEALGLDSVSTFECLVMPEGYAFMELNARIQVEHRVTEQCYALKFCKPDEPDISFTVQSLIEMMVLLAWHGERLPKPERVLVSPAAAEVRLNATDAALNPHAGGLIERWTVSQNYCLWDEQGIVNRVTEQQVPYRLAGAYDSNVALLVVRGQNRQDCFDLLRQGLAQMTLVGQDLQTNANFHQGILAWLRRDCVYPRVPTYVVAHHLRAVAHVAHQFRSLPLENAWSLYAGHLQQDQPPESIAAWQRVLDSLRSFTLRPLLALQANPHLAYAWVCRASEFLVLSSTEHSGLADLSKGWLQNPMAWFADTLKVLGWSANEVWDEATVKGPVTDIGFWSEDLTLLNSACGFYDRVHGLGILGEQSCWDLSVLSGKQRPTTLTAVQWLKIQQAHQAYSVALGFWQWVLVQVQVVQGGAVRLSSSGDLLGAPRWLMDWDLREAQQILSPPPKAPADEIVAVSGGMFYAQEKPGVPPFVQPGQRFKRGDTLYIIEVMKMFNPVKAECDGVVEAVLISGLDGQVVRKGQPLFKIKPDTSAQSASKAAVPMPSNIDGVVDLSARIARWFAPPDKGETVGDVRMQFGGG